jgi:hypothetical protein
MRLARVLLLLALVAGCGDSAVRTNGDAGGGSSGSGIEGIVLVGPQCPVERADSPCPDRPLPDAEFRVVKRPSGDVVRTVRSGKDGRFRVALDAGDYTLEPVPGSGGFPFGKPTDVTVRAGAYTNVTVSFDSGIR